MLPQLTENKSLEGRHFIKSARNEEGAANIGRRNEQKTLCLHCQRVQGLSRERQVLAGVNRELHWQE